MSGRGGNQVARQHIEVGFSHAGKIVTIETGDTTLRVIDEHGELIAVVPRSGDGEISRFKVYGSKGALENQAEITLARHAGQRP